MRKNIICIALLFCSLASYADEGMWMLKDVDGKVASFADAIVSFDFMGTGSLISNEGLVVTNHHVTYGDVFNLSTAGHNLLEDGFWARSRSEEIPIPGRHVQILHETVDVTDEVMELFNSGNVKPGPMAMRKVGGIIESRYEEKYPGYAVSLGSFWSGSKYYVSVYRDYADVRLVATPPVCIGAFGGDVDNWEWPQQKGDFAMVRIYTAPDGSSASYAPENVPLHSPECLKVSTKGFKEGSRTYVIGYPGHTDRYASSAKVMYMTELTLPIITEVRGGQMAIIKKWMDADPAVRLKYADKFFMMSNAQELYDGEVLCYKRFKVADEKREQEKELAQWIEADSARKAQWGTLLDDLKDRYQAVRKADWNLNWYRECLIRGCQLHVVASRLSTARPDLKPERLESTRRSSAQTYASIDLRVERDIFRYTVQAYYEHVDEACFGPFQKELKARFGNDYDALCNELWDNSWMTDEKGIAEYIDPETPFSAENIEKWHADPLYRFFEDVQFIDFNKASRLAQGDSGLSGLDKEYTHALYRMNIDKGRKQYPNANSTLRVNSGSVKGFSPRDAVSCDWKSTVAGLLEKHDPAEHDFCLNDEWKTVLESADPSMPVNFITDNDITGGNSGSPVLDRKGRVIGLCFDGNKESLASDVSFTPDYNRCVCVDIRFVVWTLRNYAHLDNILNEINF